MLVYQRVYFHIFLEHWYGTPFLGRQTWDIRGQEFKELVETKVKAGHERVLEAHFGDEL